MNEQVLREYLLLWWLCWPKQQLLVEGAGYVVKGFVILAVGWVRFYAG